ncbi:MAG: hypothetical protein ABEH83_05290, partial [Halobacterium sp.]
LALLVALAGCSFDRGADPVAACEGSTVAFHGDGVAVTGDGQRLTYGYEIPAGADVLLVATVNGSVVGIEHATATDSGVAVDNATFALERNYTGTQSAALAMYADVNGNGEFDQGGVDRACLNGGEPVATGTVALEFPANDSQ